MIAIKLSSDNINELLENISKLKKIYDVVRLVDPLEKKIVYYKGKIDGEKEGSSCYAFWKNNMFCENCVSMRAINEENTFVKIEYNKKDIYMVMASPVEIDGYKYVLEILKDITETGIIQDVDKNDIGTIDKMIKNMTESIVRDELTCVYNKRYIKERLPVDIFNSAVSNKYLSVIMCDVDHFKAINDTYGHLAGDYVLKEIAKILSASLKKSYDWVAKYGGDEFLVVLINTDQEAAFNVAEEMRQMIEKTEIKYNNIKMNVSASFGVHTIISNQITVDELIEHVDKNLYKAKAGGRNMTVGL